MWLSFTVSVLKWFFIMEKSKKIDQLNIHQETIISFVEKYRSIIEDKKTNLVFNKQKNECWEKLAGVFHSNDWPQNWPTTKKQNNLNLKTR
ncbi:unnamed protein product [Acanthoscelides obtectus]|uniref:Regulatory protein zeste n=1 Tax=Acanthoscelides obtectus TaxID=200917 RepID=A0A9P0M7S2_ACAOB|nr:unnamed protein product [Acanthoscelides obtectus]CAK1670186.1 hypothetical protein AOBTE_LOCUS27455 [Acanthoscelides obtectus]